MTDGINPRIPPPSMLSVMWSPHFGGGSRSRRRDGFVAGNSASLLLLPLQAWWVSFLFQLAALARSEPIKGLFGLHPGKLVWTKQLSQALDFRRLGLRCMPGAKPFLPMPAFIIVTLASLAQDSETHSELGIRRVVLPPTSYLDSTYHQGTATPNMRTRFGTTRSGWSCHFFYSNSSRRRHFILFHIRQHWPIGINKN
jgi:hypothetical protein